MKNANRFAIALGAALLLVGSVGVGGAATITIINGDGVDEGFNDTAPAAPVGGNPGTTVGQQRLNVFQYAADLWGNILPSAVTIEVDASFDPLSCTANSAVLGSTYPTYIDADFPNAEFTGTWYNIALANKEMGYDDVPGASDITTFFNSDLGNDGCLTGSGWYYGYDGNEGNLIDLLPVVIHELGHGLGFTSQVNLSNGQFPGPPYYPTLYSRFTYDNSSGKHWSEMTNFQRIGSATNTGNVVWDGAMTTAAAPRFLARQPRLTVNDPIAARGNYVGAPATFGKVITGPVVTADVVQAYDGVGTTSDACEACATMTGQIALVDRGTCTFATKAHNVQVAGAVGMILANNVAGDPPAMGGTDNSVSIPLIGVDQGTGNLLKANLTGLNATITVHPTQLHDADAAGHPKLYTPNPVQGGSSISHWDTGMVPNLLMEPAINSDLQAYVDLTRALMGDLGWFRGTSITSVADQARLAVELRSSPNPFGGSTAVTFQLRKPGAADLDVYTVDGRHVRRLVGTSLGAGGHSVVWNGFDDHGRRVAAGVYLLRLKTDEFTATGRTVRLE